MNQAEKLDALRGSILGAELDEYEARALADQMGSAILTDAEPLIAVGDRRRTLVLLAKGALSVIKVTGDKEEIVYQMRPGECAGARSFVDGLPDRAGLRAVGDSQVLTLEPATFESQIETCPWLAYKVMRALVRISHANIMRLNTETDQLRNYLMKTGGRY